MEWLLGNGLILFLVLCCVAMMFVMHGGHGKSKDDSDNENDK